MTNRRKFLIGMGSLAAGSAAAVGSGAFTSVEANRDVEIGVTGDASAFLQIEPAKEGESLTPNAEEYVHTEGDGTVYLDFTNTDETTGNGGGQGSGLNKDATTIFDNLLDFTNQGTQEIMVGAVGDANRPGSFYAENDQGDGAGSSFDVDDWPETATTIGVGETVENVGFWVKNPDEFESTSLTVTFRAERSGYNQD